MSYLDRIRLSFSGDFQADVSTVNNDVRHYDNTTFEPRFQDLAQGPIENGWWHPSGSNAFRLLNCRTRRIHLADGTTVADAAVDPAAGLRIGGSTDRVSGKLVDLDPQWQMASQIWGLAVQLVDADGTVLVRGFFEPTAFRDIFVRQVNASENGQARSSRFQSFLTGVTWAPDEVLARSPFLVALQAAGAADRLSLRLTTFGYYTRASSPRFTLGTVTGVLGPARDGEPRTFIAGRRFAPRNGRRTAEGVNFFDGRLDAEGRTALLDLSNAFPLTDPFGAQQDLGSLDLVALGDESILEGQTVSNAQVTPLAVDLPYRQPDWLAQTGGIHAAVLSAEQAAAAESRPWALVVRAPGPNARVMIRETRGGFHLRADEAVQRVDAGGHCEVELWATKLGKPLAGGSVEVTAVDGPIDGMGGGDPNAPQQPAAPIPDINVPPGVLQIGSPVVLDAQGRGSVRIDAAALGEPRAYLDGQIYLLRHTLAAAPDLVQHSLELIVLHVRSTYRPPEAPTWADVGPILAQFGNLYPVMEQIVDLTSFESVRDHRDIMVLALSLPLSDPNYMPVTRDLSAAKLQTLRQWLENPVAGPAPGPPEAARRPEAAPAPRTAARTPLAQHLAAEQLGKGRGEATEE